MAETTDTIRRYRSSLPGPSAIATMATVLLCVSPVDLYAQSPRDDQREQGQQEAKGTERESSDSSAADSDGLTKAEKKKFRGFLETGSTAYSEGDYAASLEAFEEAYRIKKASKLLFNIGLAAEKSGALEKALEYYRRFVKAPGVSLKLREKAQDRIDVLQRIVGQQKPRQQKRKAAAKERPADDEPRRLAETDPEEASQKEDEGAGKPDQGEGAAAKRGRGAPIFPITLVSVGAASIGGGVVLTVLSQKEKETFESASSPAARRRARDAAYRNQWIADGLLVAGLGAATVGTILLLTRNQAEGAESTASTHLVPALGSGFTGMGLRGSF